MKRSFLCVAGLLLMLLGCAKTNTFDPPAGVTVSVSASRIELNWKPVSSIIGYNVYRSSASGAVSAKTAIATGLTVTSYIDTTAIPGTTYYYQVTAFNSTGDSTPSPEVSATIKATPATDQLIGGAMQGVPLTMSYNVTTIAGTGAQGAQDGAGSSATFMNPIGITTDGTNLFVADTFNHSIRKIIIATGEVSTLAGSSDPNKSGTADGTGAAARFNQPYGITTDGTNLYVSDYSNHSIRTVEIATGKVTTLAGSSSPGSINGSGTAASFTNPRGITTDGTNVYVADSGNRTIRQIILATGVVSTLAGSGSSGSVDADGTAASFNRPEGLATDGLSLFLTDSANNNVRKIDISNSSHTVITVAGTTAPGMSDGVGAEARFEAPEGITTDGTNLYIADSNNNIIRKIDIASGTVTKVTGSGAAGRADGDAAAATFSQPKGITTDGANLFVTDYNFSLIREIY